LAAEILSGNGLQRTEAGPFVTFFHKTLTAHHVPFHFGAPIADVDIDLGLQGLKIGAEGEMRLLMLGFHGMVGGAVINVMAVNADAHGIPLSSVFVDL
jgi:hypothetical protein